MTCSTVYRGRGRARHRRSRPSRGPRSTSLPSDDLLRLIELQSGGPNAVDARLPRSGGGAFEAA